MGQLPKETEPGCYRSSDIGRDEGIRFAAFIERHLRAAWVNTRSVSLTDTQQAVLDVVIDFEAAEGRPPNLSEVAEEYGWTRAKAQRAVDGTIHTGALARAANRARSLQVTEKGWNDRARRESRLRGIELSPAACGVCIAAQWHLAAISKPRERQSVIEALSAGYRGLALPAS